MYLKEVLSTKPSDRGSLKNNRVPWGHWNVKGDREIHHVAELIDRALMAALRKMKISPVVSGLGSELEESIRDVIEIMEVH